PFLVESEPLIMKLKTLITIFTLVAGAAPALANPPALSVAVFDFESSEDAVKGLGPKVAALVNAHLSTASDLVLVERTELEKALGEQELGLSGTVSPDTAAKVGHLTGAKVLVTGKVIRLDRDLMLVAKLIGTETSRVYGEVVKGPSNKTIDDLAAELSEKISASISSKADTLVAKVPTREDRAEALKKVLKDARRPVVSVRIAERHF